MLQFYTFLSHFLFLPLYIFFAFKFYFTIEMITIENREIYCHFYKTVSILEYDASHLFTYPFVMSTLYIIKYFKFIL